jgi:hypothetical protein
MKAKTSKINAARHASITVVILHHVARVVKDALRKKTGKVTPLSLSE